MRLSLFCYVLFALRCSSLYAQCEPSKLIDAYVSEMEDYKLLKGYKFTNLKQPSKEFSYVLTKGTEYKIALCLGEDRKKSKVEITIFDKSRNVIISNARSRGKKKNLIQFTCKASGIYYIKYDFKEETDFCGASVLTFKL